MGKTVPNGETLSRVFLGAALDVIACYVAGTVCSGEMEAGTAVSVTGNVSAGISFVGEGSAGFLSLCAGRSFVSLLQDRIRGETSLPVDDVTMADFIAEMVNQIAGRAQVRMREHGIELFVGLPSTVYGGDHTIWQRSHFPIMVFPMLKDDEIVCWFEACIGFAGAGSLALHDPFPFRCPLAPQ